SGLLDGTPCAPIGPNAGRHQAFEVQRRSWSFNDGHVLKFGFGPIACDGNPRGRPGTLSAHKRRCPDAEDGSAEELSRAGSGLSWRGLRRWVSHCFSGFDQRRTFSSACSTLYQRNALERAFPGSRMSSTVTKAPSRRTIEIDEDQVSYEIAIA